MKSTKRLIAMLVLALSVVGVGAVSAQEEAPVSPDVPRDDGVLTLIQEQTGLTPQEVMEQVREGATLAEVITANGGDVDAVIQAATDNFVTRFTEMLNSTEPIRALGGDRLGVRGRLAERDGAMAQLGDFVQEQTGLTTEEIRERVQGGETIEDILTSVGIDKETFAANALTSAQEQIDEAVANGTVTQERADQMIQRLSDFLDRWVSGERPTRAGI